MKRIILLFVLVLLILSIGCNRMENDKSNAELSIETSEIDVKEGIDESDSPGLVEPTDYS